MKASKGMAVTPERTTTCVRSPLLSSSQRIATPSLALLSCSPSYSAWAVSASTGREGCASIFVTPPSDCQSTPAAAVRGSREIVVIRYHNGPNGPSPHSLTLAHGCRRWWRKRGAAGVAGLSLITDDTLDPLLVNDRNQNATGNSHTLRFTPFPVPRSPSKRCCPSSRSAEEHWLSGPQLCAA